MIIYLLQHKHDKNPQVNIAGILLELICLSLIITKKASLQPEFLKEGLQLWKSGLFLTACHEAFSKNAFCYPHPASNGVLRVLFQKIGQNWDDQKCTLVHSFIKISINRCSLNMLIKLIILKTGLHEWTFFQVSSPKGLGEYYDSLNPKAMGLYNMLYGNWKQLCTCK